MQRKFIKNCYIGEKNGRDGRTAQIIPFSTQNQSCFLSTRPATWWCRTRIRWWIRLCRKHSSLVGLVHPNNPEGWHWVDVEKDILPERAKNQHLLNPWVIYLHESKITGSKSYKLKPQFQNASKWWNLANFPWIMIWNPPDTSWEPWNTSRFSELQLYPPSRFLWLKTIDRKFSESVLSWR